MSSKHKPLFILLIISNILVLCAVYVLNGLSTSDAGRRIFRSTQANQSAKYNLEITPAGWTFSIWGFIYAWQAAWVIYSLILLFRTTAQGPAYFNPSVLQPSMYLPYIVANFCNIAWLFLFDNDEIQASFAMLFVLPAFLAISLAMSYRALENHSPCLLTQGRKVDIWLIRGLVHNGLGIYASWTSIAALLNLAMVIAYSNGSDVSVPTASTVALAILTVEIAAFVVTDLLFLDRYSRYTVTPYAVVVVALSGSISKNWQAGATNAIFAAVLLALGSLALVLKLAVTIYRHVTQPRYNSVQAVSSSKGQVV